MLQRHPQRVIVIARRSYMRAVALVSAIALGLFFGRPTTAQAPAPLQPLTATDVRNIITAAAESLADDTMAVAVVDRTGTILSFYARRDVPPDAPDVAVSLARTAAFFSNDQAPLSSRTVRYLSGKHFPANIPNTPNAELYGIENTNRGCTIDDLEAGIFNVPLGRPRSLRGTFAAPGRLPLPCRPSDTSGCSVGGPIEASRGQFLSSVGITTGKPNLHDESRLDAAGTGYDGVNPGGIPLYRGGRVIGGIGVAGVSAERAEFAATRAAATAGGGITTAIAAPAELPRPGAVFIDGIRLPFFGACITVRCVVNATTERRPAGSAPGTFSQGALFILPSDGGGAPEGYLIGPRAATVPGGLTIDDVQQLVRQAVAKADAIRAMIRLPLGQTTKMVIAIADQNGEFLAAFRMPDATFFSLDVALAKARNAYYFSTREGYDVLRSYVDRNPYDEYRWEPDPPAGQAWAITNRTLNFGGQPLFPPGIDREKMGTPGPWFDLFVYDSLNPCTEGPGPSRGGNRRYLNQMGIVWFPGSAPVYKNGRLVGGLGISGDGVTQDDVVSAAAVEGFEPPDELRVDRSVIRTGEGDEVRLPYFKFPRNPEKR